MCNFNIFATLYLQCLCSYAQGHNNFECVIYIFSLAFCFLCDGDENGGLEMDRKLHKIKFFNMSHMFIYVHKSQNHKNYYQFSHLFCLHYAT